MKCAKILLPIENIFVAISIQNKHGDPELGNPYFTLSKGTWVHENN